MQGNDGTENRKAGEVVLKAVLAKPVDGYITRAQHILRRGVILTQVIISRRDFTATHADFE